MSSKKTSYWRMTSLLKSLSSGNVRCWLSRNAFSAKNVSTLMPNTWALAAFRRAMLLLKVQSSAVQVALKAPGKKASTIGLPARALRVIGVRS